MSKHEPCPIEEMDQINPNNTICEVLRKIYHMTEDDEIKLEARIATTMAKKMDKKLRGYKKHWDKQYKRHPRDRFWG